MATLVTGARNGIRGIVLGSGSPTDPWRVPLARGVASAELVAWVGPEGPLPTAQVIVDALQGWRPGSPGLSSAALVALLGDEARVADDIAALVDGRDEIGAGFDALVARWSGSDGRILAPTSAPAGVEVHRFTDVAQHDLLARVDLEGLLGAAPATVVHVAVAPAAALPWPDIPADRIVDLTAPGLQAAAFTPPAAAAGDWYLALGGRDACRAGAGDEDGIQGQADRIARIVAAFAGLGGGLALIADAGAGHAARRAAEAVAGVSALVTAGTPLDPISLQVLDAAPAADALRLLQRLLPTLPADDADELGDDPDLHLGRGLLGALTELLAADDPARELRPPSLPFGAPRAGLAVHMLFGEVGADAIARAITAIVAAGVTDRAALRAQAAIAAPVAPPDRLVLALAATLATPAAPAGTLRVDGRAHIVIGELRVDDAGVHLATDRTLRVHLGVGRAGGAWLLGGPDPGRAPGAPVPHHLRRVSLDLALPLGATSGAASASITLHEARVFDLVRERWRLQASDLPTVQAGFDAATSLLPEARVLLSGVAQALAGETAGAGAALALLLRALGAIDGAGGSVPDAIEHLLNDAGARLRALAAEATSRSALVAALRALWPQGADAADGEILVAAGPLAARVSLAPPWRVEVSASAAAGTGAGTSTDAFGWFGWQGRLVFGASGVVDGSLRIGAAAASAAITGGVALVLDRALRLSLAWSRPGAAAADELELWPNPQPAAFERALARLVPAELTRQALEGLRGLDESARPIVDAALSVVGLLGDADAERRAPRPPSRRLLRRCRGVAAQRSGARPRRRLRARQAGRAARCAQAAARRRQRRRRRRHLGARARRDLARRRRCVGQRPPRPRARHERVRAAGRRDGPARRRRRVPARPRAERVGARRRRRLRRRAVDERRPIGGAPRPRRPAARVPAPGGRRRRRAVPEPGRPRPARRDRPSRRRCRSSSTRSPTCSRKPASRARSARSSSASATRSRCAAAATSRRRPCRRGVPTRRRRSQRACRRCSRPRSTASRRRSRRCCPRARARPSRPASCASSPAASRSA